jgi:nitrite reductase/ring-hydroxylating ferredoxin subunit
MRRPLDDSDETAGQAPAQTGASETPPRGGRVLCRLEEIEDGEGKGFTLGQGPDARDIFVVREGGQVFGYVNSCPHLGTPLDWQGDRFISEDSGLIMCATHGALFEIADGTCVAGPCAGQSLQPVPVVADWDGRVLLGEEQYGFLTGSCVG